MKKITSSPWGYVQSETEYGEGITFVSTESHGGMFVEPSLVQALPVSLRAFVPFSNRIGWYEEDLDIAIPVAAFPNRFNQEAVKSALVTLKNQENYFNQRGADIAAFLASAGDRLEVE